MGRHHGGGVGCCCELCGATAAVHCTADAAFLCAACDAKVHGANSIVSQHRRTRLLLTAAGLPPPAPDEDGYESAASSCVSTTDSVRSRSPSPSARTEAVLEGWAKRTGLASGSAAHPSAVAAARAVQACAHDLASARRPGRHAVARGGGARWDRRRGRGWSGHSEALRRLEACAHVPARHVAAVATSLARARARRRRRAATDAVESWDE